MATNRVSVRVAIIVVTFAFFYAALISPPAMSSPNIVMIVVDDMRIDEYAAGGHPFVQTPNIDALARQGATFTQAYHATPLCSPNRASLLTGQYASRHGIIDNTSRSFASHRLDLFAKDLQTAGYTTAHIGKWHMGNDPSPRPGYDHWVSFAGQGRSVDPILYEDGKLHEVKGYLTDVLTDRTVAFIQRATDAPFFVYVGHKAIHPDLQQLDDGSVDFNQSSQFTPAQRHRGSYQGKVLKRRPNHGFSLAKATEKPVLKDSLDVKLSKEMREKFKNFVSSDISDSEIQRRAEMMLAVDESLGRIIDSLEKKNIVDDTLIIFTSDNGYFYGEHGLTQERRLPYQEAIKAPLIMRYGASIKAGASINSYASSVDLAPTILDFAGARIPEHVQGVSLKSLFNSTPVQPRDKVLVEYFGHENPMPWTANLDYRVIVSGGFKYIKWLRYQDSEELYALDHDPYEMHNLAQDTKYASILRGLKRDMNTLVLQSMGLLPPSVKRH